jgi:hypothetical protein
MWSGSTEDLVANGEPGDGRPDGFDVPGEVRSENGELRPPESEVEPVAQIIREFTHASGTT